MKRKTLSWSAPQPFPRIIGIDSPGHFKGSIVGATAPQGAPGARNGGPLQPLSAEGQRVPGQASAISQPKPLSLSPSADRPAWSSLFFFFLASILLTCRFLRHLSYLPSATNSNPLLRTYHLLFQLGWGLPRTTHQPGHLLSPWRAVSIQRSLMHPVGRFAYRQPDKSIAVQSLLRSK